MVVSDANKIVYLPHIYTRPTQGLTIDSLIMDGGPGPGYQYMFERIPNRPVDEGRNYAIERAKQINAEFVMMADSDANWASGSIARLISHNLPVVCGTMFTRDLPPYPTIGNYDSTEADGKVLYDYRGTTLAIDEIAKKHNLTVEGDNEFMLPRFDGDIREVDGMGMHFTLIRRDVYEAMSPPWFAVGPEGAGEDFYFCRKAQEAGFKLYWDSGLYTGHAFDSGDMGIRQMLYFIHFAGDKYWKRDDQQFKIEVALAK